MAGIGVVTLIVTLGGAYVLLPLAARAVATALTATLNGSVWLAAAIGSGADGWTIVRSVASAASDALTTPQASIGIGVLVLLAGGALVGLQRLLGAEEDRQR